MECDICLIEWDSQVHIPRLLSCGHTFCHSCLKSILEKSWSNNTAFNCPTCQLEQKVQTESDINNLIKNYNLLRISEKIETRKTLITNANTSKDKDKDKDDPGIFPSFKQMSGNTPNNNPRDKIRNSLRSNKPEKPKINFDISQRCKIHNLPIHSHAIGTNWLWCDKCIKDTNLQVIPLPNLMEDLNKRLDQTLLKICLSKNEIEQLKRFLESYVIEFEKENALKIEEVFTYFSNILNYFHNSAKQLLRQCVSEQKAKINGSWKEITTWSTEWNQMEHELSEWINTSNAEELRTHIDKIRKSELRMINYINYDWEFDLLSMNIAFNADEKEALITAIQKAYHIDVEFLEIQNELPTIRQILKIDSTWTCICDEVNNSMNDVKCSSCGLFKRVETFHHCLNDLDVPGREKELYKQRRKEELEEYQQLIKVSDANDYVVDKQWFDSWIAYINNRDDEKMKGINLSQNEEIGIWPPGQIMNGRLWDCNILVRPNLKEQEDFVLINENVWNLFYLNYNGGPRIMKQRDRLVIVENRIFNYSEMKNKYLIEDEGSEDDDVIINDFNGEIMNEDDINVVK